MGNSSDPGLLREGEISSFGTQLPRAEIEALVEDRFGRKPYCLVEDWLIFHVDESPESLAKVRATGLQPMFMYAHCVIHDQQGRFPQEDGCARLCASLSTMFACLRRGTPFTYW